MSRSSCRRTDEDPYARRAEDSRAPGAVAVGRWRSIGRAQHRSRHDASHSSSSAPWCSCDLGCNAGAGERNVYARSRPLLSHPAELRRDAVSPRRSIVSCRIALRRTSSPQRALRPARQSTFARTFTTSSRNTHLGSSTRRRCIGRVVQHLSQGARRDAAWMIALPPWQSMRHRSIREAPRRRTAC